LPERGALTLTGDEAHHLISVVRVRVGDEVLLFDGSGVEARARLTAATRTEAALEILSAAEVDREAARRLTLACALPRASRMDFLVEKCCELGVARLMPMATSRGVTDPLKREGNHLRRWRRIAIEAAKQSGRTRLTEISPAVTFDGALNAHGTGEARLIASPEPDAIPFRDYAAALPSRKSVFVMIGPEGGFTEDEVTMALAGACEKVSLGTRILRVETAAVAMASLLLI